jgi:hypothetical protein
VGSRGCAALGTHVLLDLGVRIRAKLLVSLIEASGMRPGIPRPTPGLGRPVVATIGIWGAGYHRPGIVADSRPCTVWSA